MASQPGTVHDLRFRWPRLVYETRREDADRGLNQRGGYRLERRVADATGNEASEADVLGFTGHRPARIPRRMMVPGVFGFLFVSKVTISVR
jgi:hypothetical protein